MLTAIRKEKSRKQAKTDDDNSDEEDVVERPKRGATPGSKRKLCSSVTAPTIIR